MFGFTPLEPVFLTLGPLKFHYYGLMYVIIFLIGYFCLPYLYKLRDLKISKKIHENLFFFSILGGIVGARLFYVLFYNLEYYTSNPEKIIAIWEGGLASHGGFIGGVLAGYFVCRHYKLPFLKVADTAIIPVALGIMFVRFGNFINKELYGRITDIPWCMDFGDGACRHPSQLYSAGLNFILFIVMFNLRKTKFKSGTLIILFFASYAIIRFFVEFFRQPDPQIGLLAFNLSQGQWISIILFFLCISAYLIVIRKRKDNIKPPQAS